MAKLLEKPEQIRVTTNIEGMPLAVVRQGRTERVTRIYRQWQAQEQLSSQEALVNYFTIGTRKGVNYDICRDVASNMWYLTKLRE